MRGGGKGDYARVEQGVNGEALCLLPPFFCELEIDLKYYLLLKIK